MYDLTFSSLARRVPVMLENSLIPQENAGPVVEVLEEEVGSLWGKFYN